MIKITISDPEELITLQDEGHVEAYIQEGLSELGIENFELDFVS